jgi:hypothetical protein
MFWTARFAAAPSIVAVRVDFPDANDCVALRNQDPSINAALQSNSSPPAPKKSRNGRPHGGLRANRWWSSLDRQTPEESCRSPRAFERSLEPVRACLWF